MLVLLTLSLLGQLCSSYPTERSSQVQAGGVQQEGFMRSIDFDGFMNKANIPGMDRSGDVLEERQGGSGGFQSPSFNIPFQANFGFNEFSSPFGNSNSFSQFLSGLGGQGQLRTPSPFQQETEQRFNSPQVPQQGAGQFKREIAKKPEPLRYTEPTRNEGKPEPLRYTEPTRYERKPEPSRYTEPTRYERKPEQFRKPQQFTNFGQTQSNTRQHQPKLKQPKQLSNFDMTKSTFSSFDDFKRPQPVYHPQGEYQLKSLPQKTPTPVFKVEARTNEFEAKDFNVFADAGKDMMTSIFEDQSKSAGNDETFDASFEPERRIESHETAGKVNQKQSFKPPTIVERFNTPLETSKQFQASIDDSSAFSSIQTKSKSESSIKSFTDLNGNNKFPQNPGPSAATPTHQHLSKFPQFDEKIKMKVTKITKKSPTKKPLLPGQFEKKNFREPVRSIGAQRGAPHPLIRIKGKKPTWHHSSKQPKSAQGFQPFRPVRRSDNLKPGKMEIVEVQRKPIEYDNSQPIITLSSSPGVKQFKADNGQQSFNINVKASFKPKEDSTRFKKRSGVIHLPKPVLSKRPPVRRQRRKLTLPEDINEGLAFFESEKLNFKNSTEQ